MPTSDQILEIPKDNSPEAKIQRLAMTVRFNREFEKAVGQPVFDKDLDERVRKELGRLEGEKK